MKKREESTVEDQNTEELPEVLEVEVIDPTDQQYYHNPAPYHFGGMEYQQSEESAKTVKRINIVMIMAICAAVFGFVIMIWMCFRVLFFFSL